MGGHPVKCPMLNVGIQLDRATPESGQLLMIAGSHRGTSRLPGPGRPSTSDRPHLDRTGRRDRALRRTPCTPLPRRPVAAPGARPSTSLSSRPLTFEMIGPGPGLQRRAVHPKRRAHQARRPAPMTASAGSDRPDPSLSDRGSTLGRGPAPPSDSMAEPRGCSSEPTRASPGRTRASQARNLGSIPVARSISGSTLRAGPDRRLGRASAPSSQSSVRPAYCRYPSTVPSGRMSASSGLRPA